MVQIFANRQAAGRLLAERFEHYAGRDDVLVLGLARGGFPVAYEVAVALNVPLDVIIVRKLGVPGQPEYAFGAIASGGMRVLNNEVIAEAHVTPQAIDQVSNREWDCLVRRETAYRMGRGQLPVQGKTCILVDDGIATGASMRAAVDAVHFLDAARIIVAAPVASPDAVAHLRDVADQIACLETPPDFYAVSRWYADFDEVSDCDVRDLLDRGAILGIGCIACPWHAPAT